MKTLIKEKRILLTLAIAALFVAISIGIALIRKSADEPIAERGPHIREVDIASVRVLSASVDPLRALGTVRSVNEATLRAEQSGLVTRVPGRVGATVAPGTVIAEMENAAERAAVLQAQGALAAARATLPSGSTLGAVQNLIEAEQQALTTYRNVFRTAEETIFTKTDIFFARARSQFPRILVSTSAADDLNEDRADIRNILTTWGRVVDGVTIDDDLLSLLNDAEENLIQINMFVDDVATAVNRRTASPDLSQSDIAADNALMASAQAAVEGALAEVSAAKLSLSSSSTSVGVADAAVVQAEGALALAQARLESTIIRSPLAGTITRLPVRVGDFVSMFDEVAHVSREGAQEVVVSISERDQNDIAVGGTALIEGVYEGVVVSKASTLDAENKKIEVRVALVGEGESLTNGESVSVLLTRTQNTEDVSTRITVPISSLKVTTDGIFVFTVGEDNTLRAHPVSEGPLLGEKVVIHEGLDPSMEIVLDARGLEAGQAVSVRRQ